MKKLGLYLVFLFLSLNLLGQNKPFWDEIKAFKAADSIAPPKEGMVLFIGSSSFRYWKTVQDDFHNPMILNRAFGGATLLDMIAYQEDIVLKFHPKKIVIYCGENDIASAETVTPEMVFDRFKTFYATLRSKFPDTPIVYVSIKPCILRWAMKDRIMATNALIQDYLKLQKDAVFVSIWDEMLENGMPKKNIFREDNLHMNANGYAIWIKALEPIVNH
jgi:lysophospholipase L1-like esterase